MKMTRLPDALCLDEVADIAAIHPKTLRPRDISATTRRKYVSTMNRLIEHFRQWKHSGHSDQ